MAGPGANRFYSSTAVQTTLAAGISAANTSFQVNSTSGFPSSVPFILSLDQNSLSEELVLVGALSGTTCSSVTRGYDGTSATSHNNGASAVHVMSAIDLREPQQHLGAFDAVHGLSSGSLVVGTTDTQTLTNKTLTSPTINTPSIATPTITGTSTTGPISATGLVSATDLSISGLTGAIAASRYVGATTGGAPASGTFAVGDFVIDNGNGLIWICTTAGTPGTWTALVNTSTAQTLSNKTIAAGTFTGAGTGSGSLTLTSFMTASLFASSGNTGATASSRYMGATTSGAPTTGTFSVGDHIIDQTGTVWICSVAGTPGTWVPAYEPLFLGAGSNTNIVSGGAAKTAAQPNFLYSESFTVTTTAAGSWNHTTSGTAFHGIGCFSVSMGDSSGTQAFTQIINTAGNTLIDGSNNFKISGTCAGWNGSTGISAVNTALIRLNLIAIAW